MNSKTNNFDVDYSLYLVTDRRFLGDRDLCESIEKAIKGGVTVVQLREKDMTSMEFYHIAKSVKKITDKYNVPLIINDRLDIALAVDADGIHIGPDDLPISEARKLLGPKKIIGSSTCNVEEAINAQNQGANYLGVGAMFPTSTKKNTDDVTIEELTNIKNSVDIPIVAIGGINETNASTVMNTQINGLAVVSAILGKENIQESAQNLYSIIKSHKK